MTKEREALAQPEPVIDKSAAIRIATALGWEPRTTAACPNCEYHKNRAARWRAEAYKQAGHDVIELPWVGLTDEEVYQIYGQVEKEVGDHWEAGGRTMMFPITLYQTIEAKLKEKNT